MLPLDTILDLNQMAVILHQGHSRIPIFEGARSNIRGVLLVKRLIVLNPEDRRPLRTIATRWPLICSPEMPLLDILNLFQTGRSHMAIVCDDPTTMMDALRAERPVPPECTVLGIITIEDILELIIKEEISDETDLGVRSMLEHSAVVRRRIERLKSLAAKESAPRPKHMRAPSVAARVAAATVITTMNASTRVAITAPPSPSVLSPPPLVSESSALARAGAPSVSYASVEEVKVNVDVDESTPRPALPRDASFTRLVRTPAPNRSPAAPHALPPYSDYSPAPMSATHARTSSILTPRAVLCSDAMHRKDLDSNTIAVLKHIHDATVASGSGQPPSHPHPIDGPHDGTDEERGRLLSDGARRKQTK
jgi:hypothetical protein